MNTDQAGQERRREPRIPYKVPVTLNQREDMPETLQGRLQNISSRGAQVLVQQEPLTETPVCIFFHVPHQKPAIKSSGKVKWSKREDGLHLVGIEMVEENEIKISLREITESFKSFQVEGSASLAVSPDVSLLDLLQRDYAFEVYWGMLFWDFTDLLHTSFASLTCDLSMGSFYLGQAIEKLQKETEDLPGWRQYQDILNKIDAAVSSINRFSTLFRLMKSDHPKNSHNPLPEFLSLESLLSDRIQSLKNKLSAMLVPYAGEILYSCNGVPELIGIRSSLVRGLDFLLLYAYQPLLYQGAKTLQVKLSADQDSVIIDFINDGSQSLHQRFVEITPHVPLQFSALHPKDKRRVAWVVLAMQFFADQRARLLLVNESGKNVVSLRIPKQLPRTSPASDTDI